MGWDCGSDMKGPCRENDTALKKNGHNDDRKTRKMLFFSIDITHYCDCRFLAGYLLISSFHTSQKDMERSLKAFFEATYRNHRACMV
jgi:hypothetical protein